MIHLDLQPEVEAQLAAEAQAREIALDRLIEEISRAHFGTEPKERVKSRTVADAVDRILRLREHSPSAVSKSGTSSTRDVSTNRRLDGRPPVLSSTHADQAGNPDDLAAHPLPTGKDPARAALELLAVKGYRTQHLSEHQVRIMLGFETRIEVHALLAEHDVPLHYTLLHLQQDIRASDLLHSLRTVQAVHVERSSSRIPPRSLTLFFSSALNSSPRSRLGTHCVVPLSPAGILSSP